MQVLDPEFQLSEFERFCLCISFPFSFSFVDLFMVGVMVGLCGGQVCLQFG